MQYFVSVSWSTSNKELWYIRDPITTVFFLPTLANCKLSQQLPYRIYISSAGNVQYEKKLCVCLYTIVIRFIKSIVFNKSLNLQ